MSGLFTGWMFDMAREQSDVPGMIEEMVRRSAAAGYQGLGLYFEHRYAYPSAPFAHDRGALTPERAQELVALSKSEGIRLIPFLNTLGHMEGFIRAEGGAWLSEGPAPWSQQMCATRPECRDFARGLVEDILEVFDDEWVHIGGDETFQLGQCPECLVRIREIGKAGLYAQYYGDLCRWILEKGRRPCLWGDMLLLHPEAMAALPKQTLIFDWQYFDRPRETTKRFRDAGFEVFCCPSLQTYNSVWCFWEESRRLLDLHQQDAKDLGANGVWITTWESSYFTQYRTVMPLIYACGRRLAHGDSWTEALAKEAPESYAQAAALLGDELPKLSEFLAVGTWRQLRDRFIIKQNPFYLWVDWREEACGQVGDKILEICQRSLEKIDQDSPLHFPIQLHQVATQWVRCVEAAYRHYQKRETAACVEEISRGEEHLESLRPQLTLGFEAGGSLGDISRLDRLKEKGQTLRKRVMELEGSRSYWPSFEILFHDGFLTGDQAAWRTGLYR